MEEKPERRVFAKTAHSPEDYESRKVDWPKDREIHIVSMGLETFEKTNKSAKRSTAVMDRIRDKMYGKSTNYDLGGEKYSSDFKLLDESFRKNL